MATDNLSNMNLEQLRGAAAVAGLDLKQAPQVLDDEAGRRRLRRWIRDNTPAIVEDTPADTATPTPAPVTPTPAPASLDQAATDAAQNSTNRWQWVGIVVSILLALFILIFLFVMIRSINVQTLPGQFEAQATTIANQQKQIDALMTPAATVPVIESVMCPWLYGNGVRKRVASGFQTDPIDGQVYICQENGEYYPTPPAELLVPPTDFPSLPEPESTPLTEDPEGEATLEAKVASTGSCAVPANSYEVFDPTDREVGWDWDELEAAEQPTFAEFLEAHGLSDEDIQELEPMDVSWEPAMYVVELQEELYGDVEIPLLEGYVYTLALADDTVEVMWGGDAKVDSACLQWGLTARWVASYDTNASDWLNPDDPRELAGREHRYGRYLRNVEMEDVRGDVVYFDRVGPYWTGTGNLDVKGWEPPSLDASVPRNWMDACSMLGGLCNEEEWTSGVKASGGYLNWSWRYSDKIDGSATYCPQGDSCWQTTYVPEGVGYVEIWLSAGTVGPDGEPVAEGGPYKFFAADRPILADGFHNVDEFSYHADPAR